jgi:cob(I)alamin adenosyltransferase
MVIIYTGNGKGKTTSAIGTALRAIANKKKVVIIQFLKPGTSSEIRLLKKLNNLAIKQFSNLAIESFGKRTLTDPKNLTNKDFKSAKKALEFINISMKKKPFLIILDEILIALKFKLIKEEQVIGIMKKCKANKVHLILTGRGATKRLIKQADIVTEMRNVKHHFDKGAKAVKGIDL